MINHFSNHQETIFNSSAMLLALHRCILFPIVMLSLVCGCEYTGRNGSDEYHDRLRGYLQTLRPGTNVAEIERELGLPPPVAVASPTSFHPYFGFQYRVGTITISFLAKQIGGTDDVLRLPVSKYPRDFFSFEGNAGMAEDITPLWEP